MLMILMCFISSCKQPDPNKLWDVALKQYEIQKRCSYGFRQLLLNSPLYSPPDDPFFIIDSQLNLSECYIRESRFQDATFIITYLYNRNPQFKVHPFATTPIGFRLARLNEALPPVPWIQEVKYIALEKEPQNRLSKLKEIVKKYPGNPYLQFLLASTLCELTQWENARPILKEIFLINPADAGVSALYFLTFMRDNDPSNDTSLEAIHITLSYLFYEKEKTSIADEVLKFVIKHKEMIKKKWPNSPLVKSGL